MTSIVVDTLTAKKAEIEDTIQLLSQQLKDINAAINAHSVLPNKNASTWHPTIYAIEQVAPKSKADAIVLAVENGCKDVDEILEYMKSKLDVDTTKATVSSTLSRLKNAEKVSHDGRGWIPAHKKESPKAQLPPGIQKFTGEAATSSDMQMRTTLEASSANNSDPADQTRNW